MMEILAMELRFNGQYIARTISFCNCEFNIRRITLDTQQIQLYDECCQLWETLRQEGCEYVEKLNDEDKRSSERGYVCKTKLG